MEPENNAPWYLTVVRTEGLAFVRPEKSWRPIVSVVLAETQERHETVLGSDGQNPNLKARIVLRDVDRRTRLDLRVWHKAHSKKRTRRHEVGSAYISLDEVLRRQPRPGADLNVRLSCPTPQKKSPTIAGRQQHSAVLTIRLVPPPDLPSSSLAPPPPPALPAPDLDDGATSDSTSSGSSPPVSSRTLTAATADQAPPGDARGAEPPLRRRRRKRRIRAYTIDSDDEQASCSYESSRPSTPLDAEFLPPYTEDETAWGAPAAADGWLAGMMLPRYADEVCAETTMSLGERLVDVWAPYHELQRATDDAEFEKILGRLLTEWYVVGGSLLALAGIDAAVFGFSPGTLFAIDGLSERVVAFGAIAAGLGLVSDAWFLVCYSGANAEKFKRLATDVYGSKFFFCLTCRLPALCMFLSAVALMLFLLGVAWAAWPAAVLVMSFLAGTIVSLQYLVFGAHRLLNLALWSVRALERLVRTRPAPAAQSAPAELPPPA